MADRGLSLGFQNLETDENTTSVDLWAEVNGEREPIDWRSVTVSEDRGDGRDPIIKRIPLRDRPTVATLAGLFGDGEVHRLRLTFTDAKGKCCGKATIDIRGDLKRSSVELANQRAALVASPDYQFARMFEAQQTHSMALMDRMFESVEKREQFAADVMKAQTETTRELHTTLVEAVGAIEGQKATDPTTVLLKGAWNMAKPWVELGAEAGLDWVEKQGGLVKVGKKAVELATNAGAKRDTLDKAKAVLKEVKEAFSGDTNPD